MACYHPLTAFYRMDGNKKDLVFAKFEYEKSLPALVRNGVLYGTRIMIPCGMCIGCRLDYSRSWATRCVLEALQYKKPGHNWFLTLTYDVEHLPVHGALSTLDPPRLQKFLKDLRAYFKYHYSHDGIRFFACGEYGDKSGRAHYHVILFNCPIPDVELLKKSSSGCALFTSEIVSRLWPDGYAVLGECNYSSCAYTARYVMKKRKGPKAKDFYDGLGIKPEFCVMSRRPGIGRYYFDQNSDHIYEYDRLTIVDGKGKPIQVKPPAYYDHLYAEFHPDEMEAVKRNRLRSSLHRLKNVLKKTDLDQEAYLAVEEGNLADRLTRLVRSY